MKSYVFSRIYSSRNSNKTLSSSATQKDHTDYLKHPSMHVTDF